MFHANTRRLIDYWTEARHGEPAPARGAVQPAALAWLLPQIFILGRSGRGPFRFRLAGGFVGELHGAGLRERDFLSLWRADSRVRLGPALEALAAAPRPLILSATAHARGAEPAPLEISLLPLAEDATGVERLLGLYQPQKEMSGLSLGAPTELSLRTVVPADSDGRPLLRLAAVDGRIID